MGLKLVGQYMGTRAFQAKTQTLALLVESIHVSEHQALHRQLQTFIYRIKKS